MRRRLIALLLLVLCVSVLPHAVRAEDDVDPPAAPAAQAEGLDEEAQQMTLSQPCYMRCLNDGNYAHICEGICEYPPGVKAPDKFTQNQYECYQSCVTQNNWGVLFCVSRCAKWAKTLESQDVDLPPERGVQ